MEKIKTFRKRKKSMEMKLPPIQGSFRVRTRQRDTPRRKIPRTMFGNSLSSFSSPVSAPSPAIRRFPLRRFRLPSRRKTDYRDLSDYWERAL